MSTLAALAAIGPTLVTDRDIVFVESERAMFAFDAESSAADDGAEVIAPQLGTGRWLKASPVPASVTATNGGAGNAGKLLKLDAQGKAAGRVLETDGAKLDGAVTSTSGGAGNAGKLVKLDADGKLDGRVISTDGAKLDLLSAKIWADSQHVSEEKAGVNPAEAEFTAQLSLPADIITTIFSSLTDVVFTVRAWLKQTGQLAADTTQVKLLFGGAAGITLADSGTCIATSGSMFMLEAKFAVKSTGANYAYTAIGTGTNLATIKTVGDAVTGVAKPAFPNATFSVSVVHGSNSGDNKTTLLALEAWAEAAA